MQRQCDVCNPEWNSTGNRSRQSILLLCSINGNIFHHITYFRILCSKVETIMNVYSVLWKYLVCMTFLTNKLAYSVNSCMCVISLVLFATPMDIKLKQWWSGIYRYQQNNQLSLTLNHWKWKRPRHMTL